MDIYKEMNQREKKKRLKKTRKVLKRSETITIIIIKERYIYVYTPFTPSPLFHHLKLNICIQNIYKYIKKRHICNLNKYIYTCQFHLLLTQLCDFVLLLFILLLECCNAPIQLRTRHTQLTILQERKR